MRTLFIVTTKYHLGIALDILASQEISATCDLAVIGTALKNEQVLLDNAIKYMKGEIVLETEESGMLNKVRDTMLLFFKLLFPLKKEVYDCIIVFSPSLISARYRLENPNAIVYLGEDGTGSYSGLILDRFAYFDRSLKKNNWVSKFFRFIFKGKLNLNPSGLFLYQPGAITCNYLFPQYKISRMAKTNIIMRNSLTQTTNGDHLSKVVFLGQCYQEVGLSSLEMSEITEANNIFKDDFSYRKHPRDNWVPKNIRLDLSKDWELLCETIDENSILISLGSTAIQSPKFMYDKEPYIVFTFNLHPNLDKEFKHSFETFAKKLKELYRGKNKVIIVKDYEEYMAVLTQLE